MAGTHFGVVSALLDMKHPCSYTCSTICDLQVISKQDLDFVLFDFPDVRVTLTKDAHRYFKVWDYLFAYQKFPYFCRAFIVSTVVMIDVVNSRRRSKK